METLGVPLRWLIGRPELRLTVLAGRDGLDREAVWAHSIDLADPVPWLCGGELLLTTGLRLPESEAGQRAYIQRLADVGVAAVGFGTGLSHPHVPAAVVDAADTVGLPLLEVPLPTPFVAITKAVMERLAELQYEGVVRASRVQPRMTRAALRDGARAVVRELAVSTHATVLYLDDAGTVRAAHPSGAAGVDPGVLAELRRAGGSDRATEALSAGPHGVVVAQQVRVGPRTHGRLVLAADRELTAVDHLLLGHAASLIALQAEKPLRLQDEQHRVNSLFLRMVLDGTLPSRTARDHLTEAGFPARNGIRVLVLSGPSPRQALDVVGPRLAETGLPRFGAVREGRAVILLPGDGPRVGMRAGGDDGPAESAGRGGATGIGIARGLVDDAVARFGPRLWAGLSLVYEPDAGPQALQEASNAAAVAEARGRPGLVAFESLAGHVLVSAPETREVLRRVAAERLAPLAAHDRDNGTELLASLRAFLEHHGQWGAASAALEVHRHTLRSRMERIQTLLGVDLGSAHVRAELLLALAAWEGIADR
ncbi:PucR family transcriptional regulator [Streptomyces sp. NPDC057565]|uniref:PucR family transcriptional regulator n=1 Tax=Streptomyces sp. NPDC057565 TaxID=3346169 RepID=UPI0036818C0B